MPEKTKGSVPAARIASAIFVVRGHKVMLDADLAELYRVETRTLNQAVRRNLDRFPDDFMFHLTWEEARDLRSQNVILNRPGSRSQTVILKRGANIKYRPYAFTEQGVAMLSSVLRSQRAIAVNVEIMRAFVRLRELIATNKELAKKIEELERRFDTHDQAIVEVLQAIRKLMTPRATGPKRKIGFV